MELKQIWPVITSSGLIGKVKNSRQFTSTVQLLSPHDPTNRVSAEILGGDQIYNGQIEGFDARTRDACC